MSSNPLSKRRQLGQTLAWLRSEANMTRHVVGDKTRVTDKIVAQWEAGEVVPTTQEWQRLRAIFPPLTSAGSRHAEVYRAAASEQLAIERVKEQSELDESSKSTAEESERSTAIRLVLEAWPNLRSMTVEVDDEGEVAVSFKTREVRVVEDSGQIRVAPIGGRRG